MLMCIARPFAALAGAVFLWSLPFAALADPGHGESAPAAAVAPAKPRLDATSELFELVAVLDGKALTVYLDRYADNTPVDGAQIEAEIGGAKITAERRADGEYVAALPEALKAGSVPVTFLVTAGKDTDLLAGSFDLHDAPAASATSGHGIASYVWWSGGLLALAAVATLLHRRVRRGRAA